jgi:hypothetical protein
VLRRLAPNLENCSLAELEIADHATPSRRSHNRLKVPQPWPERQNEEQRQLFLERLKALLLDDTVDIWYLEEMGIEGDPRPRRRWAQKGAKIRIPYYGEHLRMNVIGLVGPRTGQFYALEFTHTDSEVFQVFLNHAN